jgi:lipoprotein-anchoring transpeptidase ErfK/SrfK
MQKKIVISFVIAILVLVSFFLVFRGRSAPQAPKGAPQPVQAAAPGEAKPLYDAASKMMARGEYPEAIKNFTKVVEKYPDSPSAEASLYSLASIYETRGELLRTREIFEKLLAKFPASNSASKARSELDRVNIKILFSPVSDPDSITYEVKPQDTLTRIAKKFNTTVDLLMRTNNLKDATIKVGRSLKITKLKFSIVIDKSQNILTLKGDEKVLKTYPVATGINNCTPVGTFKIVNKAVDPVWYSQDAVVPAGSPKNILGSRWMGISKPHYGIHGSTDPSSIGRQSTAGCVRMNNSDVEEVYAVVPIGTEVIIED